MRTLLHSVIPWAPSGYGLQCRYLAEALKRLGHDVAISAFGGCYESLFKWNGLTIMGTGHMSYGNGAVAPNYKRWNADLLIMLGDTWVQKPFDQFAGLHVMPIIPLDTDPMGVPDREWLREVSKVAASLHPVAMSEFGQRILKTEGYDAPVLPHATPFKPSGELGPQWRQQFTSFPADAFLISKVGVNDTDDRKAFGVTLQAFARFAAGKDDVRMYLHTEAQPPGGKKAPNLAYMAGQLGLKGKLMFCHQDARLIDALDSSYMRGMYCSSDVVDMATKAEGFGVPAIEALACGTPIIVADNSAMPEKVDDSYGWVIGGQGEWPVHHQSWWMTPSVTELTAAYEEAYQQARTMREVAAKAGERWSVKNMQVRLEEILERIDA